ncbi:PD-(D/E)XK nuclease-like domain-containing protein [Spirosoma oryzicola]|uniref:PD-(D/E)XK nuclease-like domain-containing protein n=1 Tax=Spirosoma oryzicola TaxID=2898794 RepID=UPI001E331A2B|nr:PD-(D/E)XK nuclease-like domain-containing protein [Spirosoma oryzicola]UHG93220.1 PD-(D/E)XK nuclease-like domain-containing protein [Spirosoma oryzicola]
MNDYQYRTLPRYANSDLSELKRLNLGEKFMATQKSLDFGTAFHTLILEPAKRQSILTATGIEMSDLISLYVMEERINAFSDLRVMFADAEKETVRQWVCPITGLPLKAKLDAVIMPRRRHLVDLKTTSCKSLADFLESCYSFDYDRQAAFYLSSDPNAAFFEFVGVQKVPPYNVYRLAFHKSDEFIKYGQKKMEFWLQRAYEESLKEDGWRPSSWSRKEVEQV